VAADDLTRVMTALSDVSGDSGETFQRASLAFSQMALKGKVSVEELNQLAEAGIPAQKLLADAMGVSTQALADMASKGQLTASKTLPLLVDAIEKKFGGATERASQSVTGLSSTLDAKLNRSFATLGQAIEPLTKDVLRGLIDLLDDVGKGIQAFTSTQEFQDFILAAKDAFSAFLEVARPVFGILLDMARAVLPYITASLKIFAAAMRVLASAFQWLQRFLKPVWDYIRALGTALKAGIDWLSAWGAKIGQWPKWFGEAVDAAKALLVQILELLKNPSLIFDVKWNVAGLSLPQLGDRVISITWSVAKFVLPAGIPTAITIAIEWATSSFSTLKDILAAFQNKSITFSVVTDTALTKIEELSSRILGIPETRTSTFSAETSTANAMIDALRQNIFSVPSWQFSFGAVTLEAMQAINDLIANIERVPVAISTAFNFVPESITQAWATINSYISQLASIPRMITTVLHTIQGDSQVADTTATATAQAAPGTTPATGSSTARSSLGAQVAGAAGAVAVAAAIGAAIDALHGGGCFIAGTPVWMADGSSRGIETITVGDLVKTWTIVGAVTTTVVETLVHTDIATWVVRVAGEDITTTADHLWLTPWGWVPTVALASGMAIQAMTGKIWAVESVTETDAVATVYNIHVDHPDHNYAVGMAGSVVHNLKSAPGLNLGFGASGAIVTKPTMALIGEAGPEALVPLDTMPGASPVGGLGGVNVDTVVINVSGYADGAGAGRAAADAFRRQLGLQRRLPFGTA
jgi:tape measure domain-containing protein